MELFSSSNDVFEEDGNDSILFLLIEFVGQMIQVLYDKTKVIKDLEAKVSYLQRQLYAPKSERRPKEEGGDTKEDPEVIDKEEKEHIEDTEPKTTKDEVVEDVHEKEPETEDKKLRKNKKEKVKKRKLQKKGFKAMS